MKVPNLRQGEISHGTGRHAAAGSEREIGDTAHPTRPTAAQRQAWSCSCHFVWICGRSPTRLCSGDAAGRAENHPRAASDLPVRRGRGVRRAGGGHVFGVLGAHRVE
jgi:hypothetical protein